MENTPVIQEDYNKTFQRAAELHLVKKQSLEEVKNTLVQDGLQEADATHVIDDLSSQIKTAKKEKAKKDMLYGALWCGGGLIATFSNLGYVFWGAIVFGGIQFFRGLMNS